VNDSLNYSALRIFSRNPLRIAHPLLRNAIYDSLTIAHPLVAALRNGENTAYSRFETIITF
jgi:hypothetical protein